VKPRRPWFISFLLIPALVSLVARPHSTVAAETRFQDLGRLRCIDSKADPDIFVWTDTCNVYVVRDGESALLIDLGRGTVLDHLAEIGVRRVEWVLFTHHHREQCQGAPRLAGRDVKTAGPEGERGLFEHPSDFRKMKVKLEDRFTVYGSSYVRPPTEPILLDRTFRTNDSFQWHGREFACVETPGNSPGAMSYLLKRDQGLWAFSGDLILQGAKMHTWFDTEWDYGFGAGIRALRKSVGDLAGRPVLALLPSHGPWIQEPGAELAEYSRKLERLERLYVRGYDVEHGSVAYQDKVSRPTVISNVVQVSPHLFKFKRLNFWPNFNLILADNGHGLAVDCGLLDEPFLDTALEGLKQHYGLKAIDAVIISHMHGDHFLEAPHLRAKWGTQIWALRNMVDKMEHPEWFDYAAPIQAYGKKNPDGSPMQGARVDRAFKPGEKFSWEGYRFTVDWMPGQTEFALCLQGQIDGQTVAFTGDNIFGDPDNPEQTGHEAMVAHNSAILEEGYIYGAEYLSRLKPDILVGGHSFVMGNPGAFIQRYRLWSYDMRAAFQELSPDPDYRYWFDPFWVRAEPYRSTIRPGTKRIVKLFVRNFRPRTQTHRIELHTPADLVARPSVIEGSLSSESRRAFPITIQVAPHSRPGVRLVGLDVTLDGQPYGERFDLVVEVSPGQ
jgi:glyoxylase-like metal-dependent hydrolase (beta-lactamase superfamily II)